MWAWGHGASVWACVHVGMCGCAGVRRLRRCGACDAPHLRRNRQALYAKPAQVIPHRPHARQRRRALAADSHPLRHRAHHALVCRQPRRHRAVGRGDGEEARARRAVAVVVVARAQVARRVALAVALPRGGAADGAARAARRDEVALRVDAVVAVPVALLCEVSRLGGVKGGRCGGVNAGGVDGGVEDGGAEVGGVKGGRCEGWEV